MTKSIRRGGGSRQDGLDITAVYEESKSQVRALGRKLETKSVCKNDNICKLIMQVHIS